MNPLPLFQFLLHSIQAHPFYWGIATYALFSNIVSAMPAPDAKSGKFYVFLFALGHLVAQTIPRMIAVLWPGFAAKFPFLSNGNGEPPKAQ